MPGSKFWWFRYSRDGQRYAQSLKTEDESLAITRARAILAEGLAAIDTFNPVEPAPRKREITGLIDQYLAAAQARNKKPLRKVTADTRKYILEKFVKDCGIGRVGDITQAKISNWLVELKADKEGDDGKVIKGKSADTCWTYGQRVRSFIKYLTPKYLPATILDGFTLPAPKAQGRQNWIRKGEVTKILDAVNDDQDLKFTLFCLFDAGLRRNEVSECRVDWFDLEQGLLHVSNNGNFVTKDRSNRTIPLTDRFAEFLKIFLRGREGSEYILARTKTVKGASKYRFDVSRKVLSHFKRCKVKATIHDAHRSFASNRVSDGVSIYKVANWLGDGLEVVDRSYGHLAPQDAEINRGV